MCSRQISRPGGQGNCTMDNQKNCLVLNIFITRMVWKKAAVIFNFCLIGNINHNFLVPIMIESAPKTFMPIQTPDLHRVIVHTISFHLRHCAVCNMYVVICGKLYLYLSHLPTYCIAIELDFYVTFIPPHDRPQRWGKVQKSGGPTIKSLPMYLCLYFYFSFLFLKNLERPWPPFPPSPTSATPDR